MTNTEIETDGESALLLARIAVELTICARETYEAGTTNVLDPGMLREFNELLHRVISAIVARMSGADGFSVEAIVEMVRSFGVRNDRVNVIEWHLNRAFAQRG